MSDQNGKKQTGTPGTLNRRDVLRNASARWPDLGYWQPVRRQVSLQAIRARPRPQPAQ